MKQTPFLEQDSFVNLLKAHDKLLAELSTILRESGLSEPQFNVLRILRGASSDDLPCSTIADRMITRQPDMTRILDRLEQADLINRKRSTRDRRVVKVRIVKKGLDLLADLDGPVRQLHLRQFRGFSKKDLAELNRLLNRVLDSHQGGD